MTFTTEVRTEPQSNETLRKTITTEVIQTEIQQKSLIADPSARNDFEFSSRNFIDWIDSIERLLDEKQLARNPLNERLEIVQEVKTKYLSYDEQFKALIRAGNGKTEQLREGQRTRRTSFRLFSFQLASIFTITNRRCRSSSGVGRRCSNRFFIANAKSIR